jgi:hypothetical protein
VPSAAQTTPSTPTEIAERIDELNAGGLVWTALAEVETAAGRDPEAALDRALALYEAKGNVTAASRLRARA